MILYNYIVSNDNVMTVCICRVQNNKTVLGRRYHSFYIIMYFVGVIVFSSFFWIDTLSQASTYALLYSKVIYTQSDIYTIQSIACIVLLRHYAGASMSFNQFSSLGILKKHHTSSKTIHVTGCDIQLYLFRC